MTGTKTRSTLSSRLRDTGERTPKEKKNTMEAYWLPGVNALGHYGRWAFAEFTDVFDIEPNLRQVIDSYSLTAVH